MQNEYQTYAGELIDAGLLIPSAVPGLYGRSPVFESIAHAVDQLAAREAKAQGAVELHFPPIVPRETLRKTGYMGNFPHLCGSVHSFEGKDRDQQALLQTVEGGGDWTPWMTQTDVTLCPAACYSVYPTLTGALPEEGKQVTLWCYVFRREPSEDPARMQVFRMREDIRIGTPDQVMAWRDRWMKRGKELLDSLGLEVKLDVANDPFFGRGGKMMGKSQREQELKFELLAPIASKDNLTAICSLNYHQEHFAHTFGIDTPDGAHAHTACIGFGLERVTLALLKRHGFDPDGWPSDVREQLWG